MPSLVKAACNVLSAPTPEEKVRLSEETADAWRSGTLHLVGTGGETVPVRPARPDRPVLRRPGDMPKRSKSGTAGRIALVHAIAHIEFNAIDLAWDIIARFADEALPKAFYDDWVGVAADEARHFRMLCIHLNRLGAAYGDLPAHDGLWEAAEKTSDDLLNRLAIVPMVLEARGLDTTPATIERLMANGDEETAGIFQTIAEDEVDHVRAGVRWFEHLCAARDLEPVSTFKRIVRDRFTGSLKPPFNTAARTEAGMHAAYYADAS